jgi:hypothetical protein
VTWYGVAGIDADFVLRAGGGSGRLRGADRMFLIAAPKICAYFALPVIFPSASVMSTGNWYWPRSSFIARSISSVTSLRTPHWIGVGLDPEGVNVSSPVPKLYCISTPYEAAVAAVRACRRFCRAAVSALYAWVERIGPRVVRVADSQLVTACSIAGDSAGSRRWRLVTGTSLEAGGRFHGSSLLSGEHFDRDQRDGAAADHTFVDVGRRRAAIRDQAAERRAPAGVRIRDELRADDLAFGRLERERERSARRGCCSAACSARVRIRVVARVDREQPGHAHLRRHAGLLDDNPPGPS